MKKYLKYLLVIVLTFFVLTNVSAEEKEINRLKIKAGEDLTIDQIVNGSAIYAGRTVKSAGTVNGIAVIAAETIDINGEIEYGMLAAREINVTGKVSKDAALAAENITIEKNAIVDRDILMAAGKIKVSGTFNRDVTLTGDVVVIEDANIKGKVRVYADQLVITKDTKIEGKLTYQVERAEIAEDALIAEKEAKPIQKIGKKEMLVLTLKETIYSIIAALVVFVVLHLIAPKMFSKIVEQTKEGKELTKILLIGLCALIVAPVVAALLMVTLFGMGLGFLLLNLYIVVLALSTIFAGYVLGYYVWNKLVKKEENEFLFGAIGIILVKVISLIPYIGGLLGFIVILFGLGTTFTLIKNIER